MTVKRKTKASRIMRYRIMQNSPLMIQKQTVRYPSLRLFSAVAEAFLELVYTAAGIHKLLLTREKRMAFGANLHLHITFCGSRHNGFTAGALDRYFLILRMDTLFHFFSTLSLILQRLFLSFK